jgi:hypothetical protein
LIPRICSKIFNCNLELLRDRLRKLKQNSVLTGSEESVVKYVDLFTCSDRKLEIVSFLTLA